VEDMKDIINILLSAIEFTPGGISTVHNYTHNNTHNNTINLGRVRAVLCLCELHPGVCFTTEEKARENFSQGSRRVPDGTMKTEYTEHSIHSNKNT
jgi:hypothetical protein